MFPGSRLGARVWMEVYVVRYMNDGKTLLDKTTDQCAKRVTILSRGRNGGVYFLPVINPRLILVSHFRPVNVMLLEAVPFPIPILFAQADKKRVGATEMIEAVGSHDACHLPKYCADVWHEAKRIRVIDHVERSFFKAGKVAHVSLPGFNFNSVMCSGFLISPQLLIGKIKHGYLCAE